jgi:hypothetical protein
VITPVDLLIVDVAARGLGRMYGNGISRTGLSGCSRPAFTGLFTVAARYLRWQALGVVAGDRFFKPGERRRDFHLWTGSNLRLPLPDNLIEFYSAQDNDSVLPVYTHNRNTTAFELKKRF